MTTPRTRNTQADDQINGLSYTIDELIAEGISVSSEKLPNSELIFGVQEQEEVRDYLNTFTSANPGNDATLDHLELHAAVEDPDFELLLTPVGYDPDAYVSKPNPNLHKDRDLLFEKFYTMFGDTSEAYQGRICLDIIEDTESIVLMQHAIDSRKLEHVDEILAQFSDAVEKYKIPISSFRDISRLYDWKGVQQPITGLRLADEFFELPELEQVRLIRAGAALVLQYQFLDSEKKETDEIKKLFYAGCAAVYEGNIDKAKSCLSSFLTLSLGVTDEVTLGMCEFASHNLRQLELIYLQYMRQQTQRVYAERMSYDPYEENNARWRDNSLALFEVLEANLRSGQASTLLEAMDCERFKYTQALQNADLGYVRVEKGWVMRNPFPLPMYNTPQYKSWGEASLALVDNGEIPDPTKMAHVELPLVELAGGAVDCSQNTSRFNPLIIRIAVGPEGGAIILKSGVYRFPPASSTRLVAIDGAHLFDAGLKEGVDYHVEDIDSATVSDIFSTGPEDHDPVIDTLLAVNTPAAWQITGEPEGKVWTALAVASEIADQGLLVEASEICADILTEEFQQVATEMNPKTLQEIVSRHSSAEATEELKEFLNSNLQSAQDESPEDFLAAYPSGWPTDEEYVALLEQERAALIAHDFGVIVWDLFARMVSLDMLKLSPAKLEVFELYDDLVGAHTGGAFPSEIKQAAWLRMGKEEAKWFLPSLAIGFGPGLLARLGLRLVPVIAEGIVVGSTRAALTSIAIYSASSVVEGVATDVTCFVWSGGADPVQITDIMYYSALNLAFHGSSFAVARGASVIGKGARDIERMASGYQRMSSQGAVLGTTLMVQASLMTAATYAFDDNSHLINDGSLAEDWFVNLARATVTTGLTFGVDRLGYRATGVSILELERRSLLRAQHAQTTYQMLTKAFPEVNQSTRVRSALVEADHVVPSALTFMPVQKRLTAEQIIEMRQAGLTVLIDRWNSNAGPSAKGFLTNVDDLSQMQIRLEAMAETGGQRSHALALLDALDSLSIMTLAQAKGVATSDGLDPQLGHSAGVDAAFTARRSWQGEVNTYDSALVEGHVQHFQSTNAKTQLYSAAFLLNMTQANSISKQGASSLKMAIALLTRVMFERSPLNYSTKLGDNPGDSSISNHVIMHVLLGEDGIPKIRGYMSDLPVLLRDMIVTQLETVSDLKIAISRKDSARQAALRKYGEGSAEYIAADRSYNQAVATLEQMQLLMKSFRLNAAGEVEVFGERGVWFPLSAFELEVNGSVERLNMDEIYSNHSDKNPSYVHRELHRARNAAIGKVEYRYDENQGKRGLPVEQRLMDANASLPQGVPIRYLFPEGRYLDLDDLTQNLMRIIGVVLAKSDIPHSFESITQEVEIPYILGTFVVRALQVQGENLRFQVSPKSIHEALMTAETNIYNFDGENLLAKRDASRRYELNKLGLNYDDAISQGVIWQKALMAELIPQIITPEGVNLGDRNHGVEVAALYQNFRFENIKNPTAQQAIRQLSIAFHGPLTPEGIVLYRSMGGVVEAGRVLRYIYGGTNRDGVEPGLFDQIDQLRARLSQNPDAPLTPDDLVLLQRLARMSRVSLGFCRDAAYDTRDRVTRPWSLFSRAVLRTSQSFYRQLNQAGNLEAEATTGLYLFGLEISHAKDRESLMPWDNNFFFDPNMIPIRRISDAVAADLSAQFGAKVVCEAYAMGDEMVPAFVMHDGNGQKIPKTKIVETYRKILERDFSEEFQYTYKVTTAYGDEATKKPNIVQRLKLYYLETPNGKYFFAESKSAPGQYYVVGGPGIQAASKDNPHRLVSFNEILDPVNFGYQVDLAPTDGSPVLTAYKGKLEIRIASTEVHFNRQEMLGAEPISESQPLLKLIDEVALGLMGYDETIKKFENPTAGHYPLPPEYLYTFLKPLGDDAMRVQGYDPDYLSESMP